MRGFLGLVIVGGVLCAGWFGVAQLLRMAPDHLHARGAEVQSIAVAGFPLRIRSGAGSPRPARAGLVCRCRASVPAQLLAIPRQRHTVGRPHIDKAGRKLAYGRAGYALRGHRHTRVGVTRGPTLQGRELTLRGPLSGWLDSIALSLSTHPMIRWRAL